MAEDYYVLIGASPMINQFIMEIQSGTPLPHSGIASFIVENAFHPLWHQNQRKKDCWMHSQSTVLFCFALSTCSNFNNISSLVLCSILFKALCSSTEIHDSLWLGCWYSAHPLRIHPKLSTKSCHYLGHTSSKLASLAEGGWLEICCRKKNLVVNFQIKVQYALMGAYWGITFLEGLWGKVAVMVHGYCNILGKMQ